MACTRFAGICSRLIVTGLLLLVPVVASAQDTGQLPTLDQRLAALVQNGFSDDTVALIVRPPQNEAEGAQSPRDDGSIQRIAEEFGLASFWVEGICVLGPKRMLDFGARLLSEPAGFADAKCPGLVSSLDPAQFAALGSPRGLPLDALNPMQQARLSSLFSRINLIGRQESHWQGIRGETIPADAVDLRRASLHAWLEVSGIEVGMPEDDPEFEWYRDEPAGWWLTDARFSGGDEPPWAMLPNAVKRSDLGYSRSELQVGVSLEGTTNMRDLAALIAEKTGLKLKATPGSKEVRLYISASDVTAGSLLRAASLATTGTWRRFGDTYLFTADLVGVGQYAQRLGETMNDFYADWISGVDTAGRAVGAKDVLSLLQYEEGASFVPSGEQMARMLAMPAGMQAAGLPWAALMPDQQAFIEAELAKEEPEKDNSFLARSTVKLTVKMRLGCRIPDLGMVNLPLTEPELFFFPIDGGAAGGIIPAPGLTVYPRTNEPLGRYRPPDAPTAMRLRLTKTLRGYVCAPAEDETPEALINGLEKHGFNTLYLRVFTRGYTAFPSRQFARMRSASDTYLAQLIDLAHTRGIRVVAAVDVLRWSDGSRGHWLGKRPDLLDYDILGRTKAECFAAAQAVLRSWIESPPTAALERLTGDPSEEMLPEVMEDMDEASGDAVSPFCPEVEQRLIGLLDELKAFAFDGLMLDYTTMFGPDAEGPGSWPGGHNGAARQEFFERYAADSIDMIPPGCQASFEDPPLEPVIQEGWNLGSSWTEFYRSRCDDLLDSLLKKWQQGENARPVWVFDRFPGYNQTRDWGKLKGRIGGVMVAGSALQTGHIRAPEVYGGLPVVGVVRAVETAGTLRFASILARGLGIKFDGMPGDPEDSYPWNTEGIALDFTSTGRGTAGFLKLIAPAEPKSP